MPEQYRQLQEVYKEAEQLLQESDETAYRRIYSETLILGGAGFVLQKEIKFLAQLVDITDFSQFDNKEYTYDEWIIFLQHIAQLAANSNKELNRTETLQAIDGLGRVLSRLAWNELRKAQKSN